MAVTEMMVSTGLSAAFCVFKTFHLFIKPRKVYLSVYGVFICYQ